MYDMTLNDIYYYIYYIWCTYILYSTIVAEFRPSGRDLGLLSRIGQSSSTSSRTLHYAAEELKDLSISFEPAPKTPADRIRRNNTPSQNIGGGSVEPAGNVSQEAEPRPEPKKASEPKKKNSRSQKSVKKHKKTVMKKKGGSKHAGNAGKNGQSRPPRTAPASVPPPPVPNGHVPTQDAAAAADSGIDPLAAKAAVKEPEHAVRTAAKASAKKPATAVQPGTDLPPCKLEKTSPGGVKPAATPPSVSESRAAAEAIATSFQRAQTAEQLNQQKQPSPDMPAGEASDDDDNDGESSQGPPDSLFDADGMDVDKPAQEGSRKRRKRELTAQQRAARARYMKFYRSVQSVLAANIFNQTNPWWILQMFWTLLCDTNSWFLFSDWVPLVKQNWIGLLIFTEATPNPLVAAPLSG